MRIGIIPNIHKENIFDVIQILTKKLNENDIEVLFDDSARDKYEQMNIELKSKGFVNQDELFKKSDFIISIGGDGTMLNTAFAAKDYNTPLLGINFGKLGFLAEFDTNNIDQLIKDLKSGNYIIEERMTFEAVCKDQDQEKMFSINDIVIDKGRWPKMIKLTVKVDKDYVATFSADGVIIATPTGSTGYSLSTGGPIVSPKADAITLSPISPHTLTMRPLVLASNQVINITVYSQHTSIQVNCDGQRVYNYQPPVSLDIYKSKNPIRLVSTKSTNYFEILRKKLYWGLDVRNNPEP